MAEEKFILDDYEIKTALLGDPEGRPYYIEKMQSLRDKIEELSASLDDSTALENVELPDTLITIGDEAFANTGLVTISIPASFPC